MYTSIRKMWVAGALAAGIGRVASTGATAQTAVTFQLNWVAGGSNAGFAAAVQEGFYKKAGLDVKLVEGNGSGNTAQLVASGRSQIAYADAVAISQLIAKGAPMKVLSTIYQSNPNAEPSQREADLTEMTKVYHRLALATLDVGLGAEATGRWLAELAYAAKLSVDVDPAMLPLHSLRALFAFQAVVDPEAADALAKSDQAAKIAAFGGREAILNRGSFAYSPAPGTEAVYN